MDTEAALKPKKRNDKVRQIITEQIVALRSETVAALQEVSTCM